MNLVSNKKISFVVWASGEAKVSQYIARDLGAQMIVSYLPGMGQSKSLTFIRYIRQARDTRKKLEVLNPDYIWVQNPPVFAVFTAWLYARKHGARFIIDTHTAAFLDRKWRWFFPLHRFLARRAIFNTAHNYKNLEILKSWGIENAKVLQFYTPKKDEILDEKIELPIEIREKLSDDNLKIFMVNRFATDDAYREVYETARLMPEAVFFVTGKIKDKDQAENIPGNVILTGFLKHAVFIRLMDRCDVALALTNRPDTVLWSIRELLALRKPFVASDTEVLRYYFSDVAVFSGHQPDNIKDKLYEALNNKKGVKISMEEFVRDDDIRWQKDIDFYKSLMV